VVDSYVLSGDLLFHNPGFNDGVGISNIVIDDCLSGSLNHVIASHEVNSPVSFGDNPRVQIMPDIVKEVVKRLDDKFKGVQEGLFSRGEALKVVKRQLVNGFTDTVLGVNDKRGHEVKPGSLGISEVRVEDATNGINRSGVVNVHNDQRLGLGWDRMAGVWMLEGGWKNKGLAPSGGRREGLMGLKDMVAVAWAGGGCVDKVVEI